jgi:hypothetical protein
VNNISLHAPFFKMTSRAFSEQFTLNSGIRVLLALSYHSKVIVSRREFSKCHISDFAWYEAS